MLSFLKITVLVGAFFSALYFSDVSLMSLITFFSDRIMDEKSVERVEKNKETKTVPLKTALPPIEKSVSETNREQKNFLPKTQKKDAQKNKTPHIVEKIILPRPVPPVMVVVPPLSLPPSPTPVSLSTTTQPTPSPDTIVPMLPALNEEILLRAVVKIECPTADNTGKYIGSGFVIKDNVVITAAHVVKDSGSEICTVIFSRDRRPIHYLKGTIQNFADVKMRHDEKGIDIALLTLPSLAEYDDARSIFQTEYPFIPYPICINPAMLGDRLLHFGYPSNFVGQNYLMSSKGDAELYADIKGIKDYYSETQGITYKTPDFSYTNDQSVLHPYMVSRVPTFYGDSGGLAFNAVKQCILGPHRGGTIGGGAGENFSVFPLLGWEGAYSLLQKN